MVGGGLSVLVLGLGIAWCIVSRADIRSEEAMTDGARHVSLKIGGSDGATLSLVCFHEDKFRMMVVGNAGPGKNRRVAGQAEDHKAIAACNGGYFIVGTLAPLGLEIAQGVATGALGSSGDSGALFGVRNDQPFIEPEKGFHLTPDMTSLVQCGPLYVDGGWHFHVTGEISNNRTFVMTDGQGQWAIGMAEHMSLNQLADLLARPGLLKGFHVQRAMNLDGGPSTGFWWRDKGGGAHEKHESWRVRNVVLVVPR